MLSGTYDDAQRIAERIGLRDLLRRYPVTQNVWPKGDVNPDTDIVYEMNETCHSFRLALDKLTERYLQHVRNLNVMLAERYGCGAIVVGAWTDG